MPPIRCGGTGGRTDGESRSHGKRRVGGAGTEALGWLPYATPTFVAGFPVVGWRTRAKLAPPTPAAAGSGAGPRTTPPVPSPFRALAASGFPDDLEAPSTVSATILPSFRSDLAQFVCTRVALLILVRTARMSSGQWVAR